MKQKMIKACLFEPITYNVLKPKAIPKSLCATLVEPITYNVLKLLDRSFSFSATSIEPITYNVLKPSCIPVYSLFNYNWTYYI